MLSRVADSLFWTSRYVERAENVARLVAVNGYLTLDLPSTVDQWSPLIEAMGGQALFDEKYGAPTQENVVRFLTYDEANPSSILAAVQAARSNARSVREFITLEMWEQLNRLYLKLGSARDTGVVSQDWFDEIITNCQLIGGITDATMSHNEGWHFYRLGRMLERADNTSRMLDVRYLFSLPMDGATTHPYDDILWAALLRSISALEMYRKKFHQILPERLVVFLILDQEFPRSIHHCVVESEEAVRAILDTPSRTFQNRAEQQLGRLRARLDYTSVEEILAQGVHEFIDTLQLDLNEVNAALFETFFRIPESA
jgi:uncharacterized alpha-E superfamily protein